MIILAIAALLGGLQPGGNDPRYPSLSPAGDRVAFSLRGDLWMVPAAGGDMRFLAGGEHYEYAPEWSPDGSMIAFTSDRSGGGDVYVMPSGGGISTRLTFHSMEDRVVGWSAGSDSVLFVSSRHGTEPWVWSVPLSGGTPVPAARVGAEEACPTPSGLVVERGYTPWWRRRYEGSASRDLWIRSGDGWDLLAGTGLDESWPMYDRGTGMLLYVREDGQGDAAIWGVPVRGGEPALLVSVQGDLTFPSIAADGGLVAVEHEGGIVLVDTGDRTVRELSVDPSADLAVNQSYGETVGYYTGEIDVDREGTGIALGTDGDLFAGMISDGEIEDPVVVASTPAIEASPAWSPDGDLLAFTRESGGRIELLIAHPAPGDTALWQSGSPTIEVLETETDVASDPAWSPDGTMISFLDASGRLHVVRSGVGGSEQVCDTPDILHHAFSPDGRYIAFSVPVLAHREEVFVVPSTGGEPVNVSRHSNDDFQPFWPEDGRRLVFASRTDDGEYMLRQVWLRREDWDADEEEREELIDSPVQAVEIDFDGIRRRTETLCTVEGWYDFYGASPDGRLFAFPGWDSSDRMDLWTVDWKGESLERLTWSSESPWNITVTEDETIYYVSAGGAVRSATVAGSQSTYGWRMPVWRDLPALRAVKFDQAWRLLRDGFYDPAMHDTDWTAARERYRERAAACVTDEEFNDVVRRMLGELSASHLGIWGPWSYNPAPRAGCLGVLPDYGWTGEGILVDSVIPYSPADLEGSRLEPGDRILSVHGMEVGPGANLSRALLQRSGTETVLEVRRGGELVEVVIDPVSAWEISRLAYEAWVDANRRAVSRLTDNSVGYLHIPSMSGSGVEDFRSDLFAEGLGREAMIVDIRDNGGGSTHDEILRELRRPVYSYSMDRYGNSTLEPLGVWQGPLVLIINERCYSDAEIFPAGWKELDLGPVVGESTYGAVIGTVNVDLFDGATFRIPSTGWFTVEGTNLENTGVAPDVRVVELPGDAASGIDRQLEAAAGIALELLE